MNVEIKLFGATPHYQKGVDIPIKEASADWSFLVDRGTHYLADTAFVTGEPFQQHDTDALKQYYQEVLDYQEQKYGADGAVFNRSLLEHLSLAERIGDQVANDVGIDTYQLKAVLLTHDLGRMMSHRRGRNNAIEAALSKRLHLHDNFTQLMPPDTLWTGVNPEALQSRLKRITSENQGIVGLVELIDVVAKWSDKSQGVLRKIADVVTAAKTGQKPPSRDTMWPSEYHRQQAIYSQDGEATFDTKYGFLAYWFEEKTDKSLDEYLVEVEKSLQANPLGREWWRRN